MFKKEFSVKSHGKTPTYINITDMVNEAIKESQINDGLVIVLTKHTTCSVFYEEFTHDFDERGNEFLQNDLDTVLEKIIPNHNSATTYSYPGPEHYKDVETSVNNSLGNLKDKQYEMPTSTPYSSSTSTSNSYKPTPTNPPKPTTNETDKPKSN